MLRSFKNFFSIQLWLSSVFRHFVGAYQSNVQVLINLGVTSTVALTFLRLKVVVVEMTAVPWYRGEQTVKTLHCYFWVCAQCVENDPDVSPGLFGHVPVVARGEKSMTGLEQSDKI